MKNENIQFEQTGDFEAFHQLILIQDGKLMALAYQSIQNKRQILETLDKGSNPNMKITEADDNSAERGEVMTAVKIADLISAIDSIFPLQIFFDNYIVFANGSINGGKVFS